MKSVGEAMAIGRTFREALGKAIRSLETGRAGFDLTMTSQGNDLSAIERTISVCRLAASELAEDPGGGS